MDAVLKFGGTSLGTPEALKRSAAIVADAVRAGRKIVVVVSALANERGRATDALQKGDQNFVVRECYRLTEAIGVSVPEDLLGKLGTAVFSLESHRSNPSLFLEVFDPAFDPLLARSEIVSFGERLMASIFASYLQKIGVEAIFVDAREFVVADNSGNVSFDETRAKIADYFHSFSGVPVVTGFIARTPHGATTTIGRGGSDLTAVLVACGVGTSEVELWTDVPGIMTADPRIVECAYPISDLSYDEALQAVRAGAKGIPPEAVRLAQQWSVVIAVKSLLDPEAPGTQIGVSSFCSSRAPKLVAHNGRVALIAVSSELFPGMKGMMARITSVFAEHCVNIGMLAQPLSETSVAFVVDEHDAATAHKALVALFDGQPVSIEGPTPCSVVTVVGEAMKGGLGISGRLDSAFGRAGANILSAAQAREDAISIAVQREDGPAALRAAHAEFFEHDGAPVVFLLGVGNVGGAVLAQLGAMQLPRNARLCGVADSKKMVVDPQGIAPSRAVELLKKNDDAFNLEAFVARAKRVPASQRIIVDCTPSEAVARYYPELFRQGFDVVAANKCANSAPTDEYLALMTAIRNSGRRFRDSANVGGKLGVIPMIRRYAPLITHVEAMLSGTLGWLFSNYDDERSFAALLESARRLGLTEPDPQKDLSGEDVARKLLVLLRKLGIRAQLDDIRPYVEDLRGKDEAYFHDRFREARRSGGKILRYVARLSSSGVVSAGITAVSPESPFFPACCDAENVVVIHTTTEPPIVIRGPGAGGAATAEAVLLDIIELLNQ